MKILFFAAILIHALSFSSCKKVTNEMSPVPSTNTNTKSISGYASVNGLNMYYEIHGGGHPLVLIHGGGSTIGTTFGRILPVLAQKNKVIAVEIQAHGHTADIDRPLSFKQDADDVAELLKQLKIPKANILGFSNGASTTLQLAIRHPDLVDKIIVASTMYKRDGAFPGFWDMMANATFEEMPQPYKDAFMQINPDTNALHTMFQRDANRMRNFEDIPESDIAAIRAPALIIAGNEDVVTLEHAVEMYRKMQRAQLIILPGGHGDYLGEINTPYDTTIINATVLLIEKFLGNTMKE